MTVLFFVFPFFSVESAVRNLVLWPKSFCGSKNGFDLGEFVSTDGHCGLPRGVGTERKEDGKKSTRNVTV